jgi:molybdenum cofactor biosynthesis enzyme MoaA
MNFCHFTFPVGGPACNAHCPFCVSKMTFGDKEKKGDWKEFEPNWSKFIKACLIAKKSPNLISALLTGKGEPTLYPELITGYLDRIQQYGEFPIVELQTNGILMATNKLDSVLDEWNYDYGLEMIALSVVHYEEKMNRKIYCHGNEEKRHYDLAKLIKKLHKIGYSIRLSVMLLKNFIDCPKEINNMIDFSFENEVEQLTFRNIARTDDVDSKESKWVDEHMLTSKEFSLIRKHIERSCKFISQLSFGAKVFGCPMGNGREQNVCISDCLSENESANDNNIRHLIFFPEGRGRIGYSWHHEAAVIL